MIEPNARAQKVLSCSGAFLGHKEIFLGPGDISKRLCSKSEKDKAWRDRELHQEGRGGAGFERTGLEQSFLTQDLIRAWMEINGV